MKKLITALALIFVLSISILPFSVYADVHGGTITVGNAEGQIGDKVSIDMVMSDNPGFISANLYAIYDMSVLKLVEVKDGGILHGPTHSDRYTSPYGLCWLDDLALADTHFNGKIVTLVFEILDTNKTETKISLDQDIVNFDLDYVRFAIKEGTVKIKNPNSDAPDKPVNDGKTSSDKTDNKTNGVTTPERPSLSNGSDAVSATDKDGNVISKEPAQTDSDEDSNAFGMIPIIAAVIICVGGAIYFAVYSRTKKK